MYRCVLMDLMILYLTGQFHMVMLSMEPRKWIITLHNSYCLTSYSISFIGIFLDNRNAAIASKPNVAQVTTVLK